MYPQNHQHVDFGIDQFQDFSLRTPANGPDYSALNSSLLYKGQETGVDVQGIVLDHQFSLSDGYVLVTSWDCPFEEGYEVSLLNREMKLVSHKSIGPIYSSYQLDSMEVVGKSAFRLLFTNGEVYNLVVRAKQIFPFGSRLSLSRAV